MKKRNRKNFIITLNLFWSFVLWTIAISTIDVQSIGPRKSAVGFATFNGFFHSLTGVYWFTDIIGGALLSAALVMLYYSISTSLTNCSTSSGAFRAYSKP